MKFSRKLRILLSVFFIGVLLMVLSLCAAAQSPGREIAIVYDDSGSMVKESGIYQANWCRAKYALEVFSAMLQERDEMTVYLMSNYRDSVAGRTTPLHLSGGDSPQSRTQAVHDMKLANSGTYFNAVRAAIKALGNADESRERWLIILTDGSFNNISVEEVESELRKAAQEDNIKVIYFVMSTVGNEVSSIGNDPTVGLYSYTVNNSEEILSGVIEVANQVFSQRKLSQKHILKTENAVTISLDVPVQELIVFAQGKGIRIGNLTGDQGSWTGDTQTEVKYSDELPQGNYDSSQIVVDTSLEGSLATFKPDDVLMSGTYRLQVSDASNIEVYYVPAVAVALELTGENGDSYTVGLTQNEMPSGLYQISAYLIDPLTGVPLNSDLVSLEWCSLQMENNGETQSIDDVLSGETELLLRAGEFVGIVTIGMDHYQTETSTFSGCATPAPWQGTLTVELPSYPLDENYNFGVKTAENQKGVLLTVMVTDPVKGEQRLLSQEAWENAEIATEVVAITPESGKTGWEKLLYDLYSALYKPFQSKKMSKWETLQGTDVSTWIIFPQSGNERAEEVYGTVTLRTSVKAADRDYTVDVSKEYVVKIAPPPVSQVISYLTRVGVCFVFLLIFLILLLRKKRLPRDLDMTYLLVGVAPGRFAGKRQEEKHVRIRRKFTLFSPETAMISMSQPGVVRAPNLKIEACTHELNSRARKFRITNIEEFAKVVPDTRINASLVEPGANKRTYNSHTLITCKPNQMIRGTAKCEFQFTRKPKKRRRRRR